jgi:hypothetical protein
MGRAVNLKGEGGEGEGEGLSKETGRRNQAGAFPRSSAVEAMAPKSVEYRWQSDEPLNIASHADGCADYQVYDACSLHVQIENYEACEWDGHKARRCG